MLILLLLLLPLTLSLPPLLLLNWYCHCYSYCTATTHTHPIFCVVLILLSSSFEFRLRYVFRGTRHISHWHIVCRQPHTLLLHLSHMLIYYGILLWEFLCVTNFKWNMAIIFLFNHSLSLSLALSHFIHLEKCHPEKKWQNAKWNAELVGEWVTESSFSFK